MGDTYVISGLLQKRKELSGTIEQYEADLRRLRFELHSVDVSIRLFRPDINLAQVQPRRRRFREGMFGHGELPRLILEVLGQSAEPLSCQQLAREALNRKGLPGDMESLVMEVATKASKALPKMQRRGHVSSASRPDGVLVWRLAN